jgi:hypothetical protein
MPDPAWSECCAPARFGGKGLLQLTPIADLAAEANVRSIGHISLFTHLGEIPLFRRAKWISPARSLSPAFTQPGILFWIIF